MSYDYNSRSRPASDPLGETLLKIGLLLLCITIAPALLLGFVVNSQIEKLPTQYQRLIWTSVALLAVGCLALGYHFFWPLNRPDHPFFILAVDAARGLHNGGQWNGWQLFHELLPVWAMSLLLAPAATCGFGIHEAARPKTAEQLSHAQQRQRTENTRQANKGAERMLTRKTVPDAVTIGKSKSPALVLGVPIEGTLVEWIKERFFSLPLEYLILHAVVIGASGSGKSETLIRIAVAAAKVLKWQVIFVDAKGDYKNAAKYLLAMQDAGIANVKMFPSEAYNGWVGTRDALLSRLLAIDNIAEVTNAGQQHYQTVRENLLEMAVNMPGGPPRSSQDLLERLLLTNGMLYNAYQGYPEQLGYLEMVLERPQEALGTYGHYRAFFAKLHGKLDGTWSYDDCDAAYVLLDGLAMPEIVNGIGRYLLADFVNYATRKSWNRRTLFVFDEVGALSVPVFNVFERVRFRNVSVMVSSQDPSGLAHKPGAWDEVKRVLGNAAIKIVHRSEDAHEVLRRAGTALVAEQDYRSDASGMTSGGTTRMRETLKIDQNEVLRLRAGETFVIGPGEYERVLVAMRDVDPERFEQLYQDLERQAKEEPPSLKRRQRGGQQIVDAVPTASPPHQQATSKQQKNGTALGVPAPQGKGNKGKGSSSGGQGGAKSVSAARSKTVPSVPQSPNASPSVQVNADVDETLPFSFLGVDQVQQAAPQPGVLPMWDTDEGEDLLK